MNWSKAKNILIMAFIITNIFLIYNINEDIKANNYFYEVSEERIQDVINILEDRNIFIDTDIPQETPKLPMVTVEYETYDGEKIAKDILGSYTKIDSKFIKGNEFIQTEYGDKLLIYNKDITVDNFNIIDTDDAKEIADKFIQEKGFDGEDVVYWDTVQKDNGQYEVIYKQRYNDLFIGDSDKDNNNENDVNMRVIIQNGEVINFRRKWLNVEGPRVNSKRVIPVTKALLMAIEDIENVTEEKKVVITDISLGYILDISKLYNFIKWYDIDTGDASPYWRITLENKECIYIEAYD